MAEQVGCRRIGLERCGVDVTCNHCVDTKRYINPGYIKVVVPYVRLHPWIPLALREQGFMDVVYHDTSGSETAYWELLANLWERKETFICLEQDKLPTPGTLEELWTCEQPWCTYHVFMQGTSIAGNYPSLSCVKFDSSLMIEYPELLEEVALYDLGFGKKHWNRLDMGIFSLLDPLVAVHWHKGNLRVVHLHEGGSDGE